MTCVLGSVLNASEVSRSDERRGKRKRRRKISRSDIHTEEEDNKSNPPVPGTHSELENKAAVSDPEKSFGPLGSLSGDFSLLRDQ